MNKKELFNIKIHFSTPDHIVCIGKSIHNDYFLLVITVSNKPFPIKDFNNQNEIYCITKYKEKYYKIEVSIFRKIFPKNKILFDCFLLFKNKYDYIFEAYKENKYNIRSTINNKFSYDLYAIPKNVWLICSGYILGII